MAKGEPVLEGAVQALQDAQTPDLSDAAAGPLPDILADLLEMAGGEVRTGVTLPPARSGQPQRR